MLRLTPDERGDTIVEVLIAVAIVSLIIVSAYVITNLNTRSLAANSERIQAQHLVEGQIEALRANNGLTAGNSCFKNNAPANVCNDFTQAGSGATYTINISGPSAGVYTIKTTWTSLIGRTNNDSNVTMYYRLQ